MVPLFERLQRATGVCLTPTKARRFREEPSMAWTPAPFTADDIAPFDHTCTMLAWDAKEVLALLATRRSRAGFDALLPGVRRVFGDGSTELAQVLLYRAHELYEAGEAEAALKPLTEACSYIEERLLPGISHICILWLRVRVMDMVRGLQWLPRHRHFATHRHIVSCCFCAAARPH